MACRPVRNRERAIQKESALSNGQTSHRVDLSRSTEPTLSRNQGYDCLSGVLDSCNAYTLHLGNGWNRIWHCCLGGPIHEESSRIPWTGGRSLPLRGIHPGRSWHCRCHDFRVFCGFVFSQGHGPDTPSRTLRVIRATSSESEFNGVKTRLAGLRTSFVQVTQALTRHASHVYVLTP